MKERVFYSFAVFLTSIYLKGNREILQEAIRNIENQDKGVREKLNKSNRDDVILNADFLDIRRASGGVVGTFNNPLQAALMTLKLRAEAQGTTRVHSENVGKIPMGGMTYAWSAGGLGGFQNISRTVE